MAYVNKIKTLMLLHLLEAEMNPELWSLWNQYIVETFILSEVALKWVVTFRCSLKMCCSVKFIILSTDNYSIIGLFICRNKHIRFMKIFNFAFYSGNSMWCTCILQLNFEMFSTKIYVPFPLFYKVTNYCFVKVKS